MNPVEVVKLSFPDGSTVGSLLKLTSTPKTLEHFQAEYSNHYGLLTIDTHFKLLAMRYGRPYGFKYEQNGATVQNLFPIQRNELEQISSSSKAALEMHTETAFHRLRPHIVCILCVRADTAAHTTYASLPEILPLLSAETIRVLHGPYFVTVLDQSFLDEGSPNPNIVTPILFDQGSRMTYDRALMRGITVKAQIALQQLSDAIDKVTRVVTLGQGDVLVLHNERVVHGRTPFMPRYDGTDRWLKRIMVRHHGSFFDPDETTIATDGLPIVTSSF